MSNTGKQLAPSLGENTNGKISQEKMAQKKYQGTRCWRLCRANNFRQALKKCLEKILRVEVPLTFEILYLRKMNIGLTRFGDKCMFRIMLIASKKAPKVEDWVDVIHNILYMMEKLTFSSRLELDKFNRI